MEWSLPGRGRWCAVDLSIGAKGQKGYGRGARESRDVRQERETWVGGEERE